MYLIDHNPTENDIKEMRRWLAIYNAEVARVARVLNYWRTQPFKCAD